MYRYSYYMIYNRFLLPKIISVLREMSL